MDEPKSRARSPARVEQNAWLFGALVALGVALRLHGRDVHSLWFDETMTIAAARADDLVATLENDRQPPLSILLFRGWIAIAGEAAAAIRLLPALVSCISLALFARLARTSCTGSARPLAVALLAVSPFGIWYAQEIRAYFLLELCAIVCLLALQRARSTPAHGIGAALAILLACAVAFGSHYMGALLVFTVAGVAALARARGELTSKQALLPMGAAIAGCALWSPWLVHVTRDQLANPWGFTARLSARDLAELPLRFFIVEADALPGWLRVLGYALGAALLVAFTAAALRALRHPREPVLVALVAFLAPVLGAFMLALISYPNFAPRYLIVAEPAAVLLVACGLAALTNAWPRRVAGSIALAGCLALSFVHKAGNHKEDFRTAYAEVVANWRPGDRVCSITGTVEGFSDAPLRHYLREHPQLLRSLVPERLFIDERVRLAAGTRVHVVYRDAPYARDHLRGLEQRAQVEYAGPNRLRVQYLRVVWN